MRKVAVVCCACLALLACLPPPPPYQALQYPATEDPDALYAATVRVFLRKGWGFQSSDPQARAVLTKWFKVEDVGLKPQRERGFFEITHVQFRVIVSKGIVEIFTDCGHADDHGTVDDDHRCQANQRPFGLRDVEQRFATEIVGEAHSMVPGQAVRVVDPGALGAPAATGCTKDTDCKGDRICVRGECSSPVAPGR